MATSKSTKQRAQGGGRTANSEPRVQVFRDFAGCNFQMSPREFTLGQDFNEEQSDLQMNYVVIQNNAQITDNKTIETRNNIETLCTVASGKKFTDASVLVDGSLFIGCEDGSLLQYDYDSTTEKWKFIKAIMGPGAHVFESLAYVDNQIVGTTRQNGLWTGKVGEALETAILVSKPVPLTFENIVKRGSLKISKTLTDECPYRIVVAHTYVNKFGPTEHSTPFTFFASETVEDWHSKCFAQIKGTAPTDKGIKAIEFYYSVSNSSSLLFAGRTDTIDGGSWSFNWIGYYDATSMWAMANLEAPTQNYTKGVEASRVTCIDSRMYFWGNKKEPQRLWIGGNPGNLFSVSPGTGGGFVDVEPGTGQEIRYVDKYKTQSGNSIVTILCDSKNSNKEQRFNLVENTITLSNEQNRKSWQAEQVSGAVGCKSYHGAKVCEDGLYSVSRYGLALTTMTMEYNSQIRANYVSAAIKPAFIDKLGERLSSCILLEADGVLYLSFGKKDKKLDNLLFCYDIDLKSWWTYSIDVDKPIIDLIHIDYEGAQEGIGIVTDTTIYLLPLTQGNTPQEEANFDILIKTGELSTTMPQQNWFYLSQLEFRFDYFIGDLFVELEGIDQFGRRVTTLKHISHKTTQFNLAEYIRVDLRLQSYTIKMFTKPKYKKARFRMTHFMAKLYTMSAKQGLVWGFNDSQTFRTNGDIHPTFKDYNDIRKAIIP